MEYDHADAPIKLVVRFSACALSFLRKIGAVYATGDSVVSFDGETVFTGNEAMSFGGEL